MGSTVTSARVAGALLVERGLVTPAQFVEALEHQRAHGTDLEEALEKVAGLRRAEVLAVVNDRDGASRVDIGSILLAGGAVDEDNLAIARERSAETGQPVGPILVEMGAISRLDLASALADQWSDSPAQILPPPNARDRLGNGGGGEGVDDLRFAMAALEASVRASREPGDDGAALEEILRREDQLSARIAALEHAIDQPVEADPALVAEIQAMAEGLEALQTSLREVATTDEVAALGSAVAEVAALRETLAALEARVEESASSIVVEAALAEAGALAQRIGALEHGSERVEALANQIAELAERPVGEAGLGERLDELARAVDALGVLAEASTGADGLREALEGLAGRVDEATALAPRLEALGDTVEGLREALAAAETALARVPELESAAARADALAESVAALAASVDELASRPPSDPALEERLDRLDAAVAEATGALGARLDEVDARAAAVTTESAAGAEGLAGRIGAAEEALDAVRSSVESLAAQSEASPVGELAARLGALEEETRSALARTDALPALGEELAGLAGRLEAVDALQDDLAGLRDAVTLLEQRPASDEGLAGRLGELADRVEALSVEALGPAAEAAVAGVASKVDQLASAQDDVAGRIEELRARLADLQTEVAGARDDDRLPALEQRVTALDATLGELAERGAEDRGEELAALAAALEEVRAAHAPAVERLDALEGRLGSFEARADDAQRAADEALEAVRGRLEEIGADVEERYASVAARIAAVESDAGTPAADDLRGEVAALGDAVEAVRASVSSELARVERAWADERAALEALIAARPPAEGSGPGVTDGGSAVPPSAPELAKLARELERLGDRVVEQERSLVEHFARRERALMERLGTGNDVGQRLSELARAVEELRQRADRPGGGGDLDGAELDALKDSVSKRLERLASSIDWRFQRLEGGPAAAAGRTDLTSRVEQLARIVEQLATASGIEGVDLEPEPSQEVYLALVPTTTGNHQLVELHGPTPEVGQTIAAPFGRGELVVVAVGTSPLPGDDRACIFVQPADQPAHA